MTAAPKIPTVKTNPMVLNLSILLIGLAKNITPKIDNIIKALPKSFCIKVKIGIKINIINNIPILLYRLGLSDLNIR